MPASWPLRIMPMQKMPATTAVRKLMKGRTTATMNPKNALVTRIESAPVSGAVIRKDMHEEREAPLRRISATTGTTEQLHRGTGTPMAELVATDLRLSSRSHRRIARREMKTWISPREEQPQQQHRGQQQKGGPEKVEETDEFRLRFGHSTSSGDGGDAANSEGRFSVAWKVHRVMQGRGQVK